MDRDKSEQCVLTNMCMLRQGTSVLVQNRKKSWKGITFPGGHVEKGESLHTAMLREFQEETGLHLLAPKLCGIKHFRYKEEGQPLHYMVFLYTCEAYEGELHSSAEGEVFWVEEAELPSLSLAEGFAEMLKVFQDPSLSEVLFVESPSGWQAEYY